VAPNVPVHLPQADRAILKLVLSTVTGQHTEVSGSAQRTAEVELKHDQELVRTLHLPTEELSALVLLLTLDPVTLKLAPSMATGHHGVHTPSVRKNVGEERWRGHVLVQTPPLNTEGKNVWVMLHRRLLVTNKSVS